MRAALSIARFGVAGVKVSAAFDAVGIKKPVVFGTSAGGLVAMAYASGHLEHPAGILLVGTVARQCAPHIWQALRDVGSHRG